eukprot:TRINITY_DN15131_c1_g1_i1.p1 TRINITY_DN15131_c1_g1~~TRINITY_DN15131_c1_g1_i1.p1  ORF type:complete len:379 (+),score=31.72 TRINITY_DN15131_c1_g1_i1:759-1895(+)
MWLCAVLAMVPAVEVMNSTMIRVTPKTMRGTIVDMDTADLSGDCIFQLFELTMPYWCRDNPSIPTCENMPILNVPGNNVYERHLVEHVVPFGQYALCNPEANGSFACTPAVDPTSGAVPCWNTSSSADFFSAFCDPNECSCDVFLESSVGMQHCPYCTMPMYPFNGPDYAQCSNLMSVPYDLTSNTPLAVYSNVTIGACCDAVLKHSPNYTTYEPTEGGDRGTCTLFDTITGTGKNNRSTLLLNTVPMYGKAGYYMSRIRAIAEVLNGTWWSTQKAGECRAGEKVGEGSCWWRDHGVSQTINATCVTENLVKGVQQAVPGCFETCAQPLNATSSCAVDCVLETALESKWGHFDSAEVCRGFESSFAHTHPERLGCPLL